MRQRILIVALCSIGAGCLIGAGVWWYHNYKTKQSLRRIEAQYNLSLDDIDQVNKAYAAGKTVEEIAKAAKAVTEARDAERLHRLRRLNWQQELEDDELKLENLELEERIAELQGKPFNHSKIAAMRAKVNADKTRISLDDDFERLDSILSH